MTTTDFKPTPMIDVEGCLNSCAAAFDQLTVLLHVIKEKAQEDGADASKVAALGYSVTFDMENFARSILDELQTRTVKP